MISRKTVIKLAASLITLLTITSCAREGFKGFYEEDLTKFLTLGEYKGFSIEEKAVSVTEDELKNEINKALASLSSLIETEEAVFEGCYVKLDRYCVVNGESVPELSEAAGGYTVGEKTDDPVIDALLPLTLGMKKGDTAELSVTVPAGYDESINSNTEATYRVTILSVSELIIPELDDETSEKLLPGCGGADNYRVELKKTLEKEKLSQELYRRKSEAWKLLVEGSSVIEVPYDVYSAYFDELYYPYKQLADAESAELYEYIKSEYGMTGGEFDEMIKKNALAKTKEALVLYSIVKKEKITFTEKELSEYASKCALLSDGAFSGGDEYLAYYGEEKVTEDLLKDKAEDVILSYAS